MDNSNSIDVNNYGFSDPKRMDDPSYLKVYNPNSKQETSPQTYSSAMEYMKAAQTNMEMGNWKLASTFLKEFGSISGTKVDELDIHKYFGGKKIPQNMKYLRGIASQYNMSTIQQYMTESKKKGLNNQADSYGRLYNAAVQASVTPEASVEVSNYLQEMLSKIKYIDRPTGLIENDISKINSIGNKYNLEKQKIEDETAENLKKYANYIDLAKADFSPVLQGARDVSGALISLATLPVDLAADVYSIWSGEKNKVRLTEKLLNAMGVNPNSWAFLGGQLLSFAEGGSIYKGLNVLRKTGNINEAINASRQISGLVPLMTKMYSSAAALITGKFVHSAASKAIEAVDTTEGRKESIPNILGAVAGTAAFNLRNPFSSRSNTTSASKPRGGGSAEIGSSPTDGGSPTGGGSPFEEGISKANEIQKENLNSVNERIRVGNPQFIKDVDAVSEKITNLYEKMNRGKNQNERTIETSSGNTESEQAYQAQKDAGRAFKGAYIDESTSPAQITNVSPSAVLEGAENPSNYSLKIMPDGNHEALARSNDGYANTVQAAAIELYNTPNVVDVDSGLVTRDENGIIIESETNAEIAKAFDSLMDTNKSIDVDLHDKLRLERKIVDIPRMLLKSEDPLLKELGANLKQIEYKAIKDDSSHIGDIARNNFENEKAATKDILFTISGINEGKEAGQVDGSKINDAEYTSDIAREFIGEVKSKISNKFAPIFDAADAAIDRLAVVNPEYVKDISMRFDELADMLDITGKSEDVNVNPLIYKGILNAMKKPLGISRAEDVSERIKLYMDPSAEANKFSSMKSKGSLGHRYRIIKRAIKRPIDVYTSDTSRAYTEMEGDFGSFKENVYDRMIYLIEEAYKTAMTEEEYNAFQKGNKEYADFRKTLQKFQDFFDSKRTGEKTWKVLSKNPIKFKELLSHIAGQYIEPNSPISRMRSLIGLEQIKQLLTIGDSGEVIFNRRITPKDFATGKISYLRTIMPELNEKMLREIVVDAQMLFNAQEAVMNPSRTAHVLSNLYGEVYGNIPSKMLDAIKSREVMTFGQLLKSSSKALTKVLKIKALNPFYHLFSILRNIAEQALESERSESEAAFLREIIELMNNNSVKGVFADRLVPEIRNNK